MKTIFVEFRSAPAIPPAHSRARAMTFELRASFNGDATPNSPLALRVIYMRLVTPSSLVPLLDHHKHACLMSKMAVMAAKEKTQFMSYTSCVRSRHP